MKKAISLTLALLFAVALLSGCGGNSGSADRAQVTVPTLSDAQELAEVTAALSVDAYLAARMKLEKFLQYDISSGSPEEYAALLEETIGAFETADKLSVGMKAAAEVWLSLDDSGNKKPSYQLLRAEKADSAGFENPFLLTARAASEDSPAVKWAKDITAQFDKAPAGKGIRTLAEQLGTDAKHAYAQLKQAQDILEGADYSDIADAANTAYETAVVLKAAGTAAGFVISIPAAPAAGTLAAVINTGGAVINGANALLEIGSAGSILYTNGEGNWVTAACDQTESQFAPIGQVFGIAGVCSNISSLRGTYKDIVEKGKTMFTRKEADNFYTDVFGVVSYGMASLSDYVQDGKVLSGTFTHTKEGLEFTLADTLCGTEPQQNKAVKKAIADAGISDSAIAAAENSMPVSADAWDPAAPIPAELADAILAQYGIEDFDTEGFLRSVAETLLSLTEAGGGNEPAGEDENSTTESSTVESSTTESSTPSAPTSGKNTIPWNGNFYGVTLPAPKGHDFVAEYEVDDDAVTVRIDGMTWETFVDYCKTLEELPGWEVISGENTANFPDGPRDDGIVYFTGAYGGLPRINVRYNGASYAAKRDLCNFSIFVFETF